MSGGNFASPLAIDSDGFLKAARGPLDPTGDPNVKLYAYVYQTRDNGSGAAFTGELDQQGILRLPRTLADAGEKPDQWIIPRAAADTAQAGGPEQEGEFQPGPATGVALAIAKTNGSDPPKTSVVWWTETIELVREA